MQGSLMKAAFIREVGSPENIIFGDLPRPIPKPKEVLVQVIAVAVNFIDTYIRSGSYPTHLPSPFILGRDMVGIVSQVGSEVKAFQPGQRVWCMNQGMQGKQGTCSEYAAVDEQDLFLLPEGVDPYQAAACFHAGLTAIHGLIRFAKLIPGETVFVRGGAGNVGSAVIQIAKLRDARVITSTTGKEKIEWCKSIGADEVFDYHEKDQVKEIERLAPNGVNIWWETSKEPDLEAAVPHLAFRGRVILMAGPRAHPSFPCGTLYRNDASILGFSINHINEQEKRVYAEIINRCLQEKKLRAHVSKTMSLADTKEAHKMLEEQKEVWGKIVLKCS